MTPNLPKLWAPTLLNAVSFEFYRRSERDQMSAILSHNLDELLSSLSDQKKQGVFLDKITSRIVKQCYGLKTEYVDAVSWVH